MWITIPVAIAKTQ